MMTRVISVWVIFFVLLSTVALAVEKAPRITDREIVERLTRLEEGQKALNKRLDDLNKRLEEGQKALNKRIDDVNKRIDDVNKRIDDLDKKLNKRIDDLRDEMNARFADLSSEMNSRFESMDARFDTLQWMLGLFITIALVILGFVLRMQWQMNRRQTTMETILKTHKEELEFLKNLIEKLLPPKGVL